MSSYLVLVYVHVLLMVFWLGTDIGVFIAGLYFADPRRPLPQRRMAMELGMVVDRFPRVCFVAMLPVGVQLAWLRGVLPLPVGAVYGVWASCALWMVAVLARMALHDDARARPWKLLEHLFIVLALLALSGGGAILLAHGGPAPEWLAGKMLAYAAVCLFAILLERSFAPGVLAFAKILDSGSSEPEEATLARSMRWTYTWVIGIYLAVIAAGFLGTVKP
jgi:hypothetical protein